MESMDTTYPKFTLSTALNKEQIRFFDANGFIHFKNFLSANEVKDIINALSVLEEKWLKNDVKQVNGIPLKFGFDENNKRIVHRFAFTSLHSERIKMLVNSSAIQSLTKLLVESDSRIAENEKDGVVVNQYLNSANSNMKQMGWHTDSLRDIFYGKKVLPMLNVGINLTDSKKEQGGLKVLKGTHKQSLYKMIFRKPHFVNNNPDKDEVSIEAEAGDLTVHHGHMWHRVATAQAQGEASKRITMYIPIVCGRYEPKHENSFTPFYHKLNVFAKK